jgi:hypothetical protein
MQRLNRQQKQLLALVTAISFVLFLAVCVAFVHAQPTERVYIVQYTPSVHGVHYVVGFDGFVTNPTISVSNGQINTISRGYAGGIYYGTAAARLDYCGGALHIGNHRIQHACLRFPFVAKE